MGEAAYYFREINDEGGCIPDSELLQLWKAGSDAAHKGIYCACSESKTTFIAPNGYEISRATWSPSWMST